LVEEGKAKLVVIAHDVDPIELVVHLPALCRRKGVPFCFIRGKANLGKLVHQKTATCVALTAVGSEDMSDLENLGKAFKAKFNRKYESHAEEQKRLRIFTENMKTAAQLQAVNPLATFGVNKFADQSASEFKVRHNSDKAYASSNRTAVEAVYTKDQFASEATTIDWRTKGAVTHVKDQGQCGSCWAFSATCSVESAIAIAENVAVPVLSEQQYVSCSSSYGNSGCNGGWYYWAWDYGKVNAQETSAAYPYTSG